MILIDETLPTVALNVQDSYETLWGKTKEALKYLHNNHLDDAEWFYKADDDTFAVMENMRHMLSSFDPSTALHLGFRYKDGGNQQGFMSGGSGYILTKRAISKFVTTLLAEEALPQTDYEADNSKLCVVPGIEGSAEDLYLGELFY